MKKFSLLFLSTLMALCLFTACSSDDEEKDENKIKFISTEDVTTTTGQEISLFIESEQNTNNFSIYIGEVELPEDNYTFYSDGASRYELRFALPKGLNLKSGENISIRNEKNEILAVGPKIIISKSYVYYMTRMRNGNLNQKLVALPGTNQVMTLNEGETFVKKKHTLEFKGFDAEGNPEIEKTWTVLNFKLEDKEPLSPVGEYSALGVSSRDGITYFAMPYSRVGCLLVQETEGMTHIAGATYVQQPIGLITHIEQDKDNNLFVISNNTPNCIQKMSEVSEAAVWAGSASESGSKDGSLTNARFENIVGMSRDSKDNLYVAQKNGIRKVSPQGEVSTLSKFPFQNIVAMTVDHNDKIYVIDSEEPRTISIININDETIEKYNVISSYGSDVSFSLSSPNIAVAENGAIFMLEYEGSGSYVFNVLILEE